MPNIVIRRNIPNDVSPMCQLLNEIIKIGGTTAHQKQFADSEFVEHFLDKEDSECCFVAVDGDGTIAGFQTLHRYSELPDGWADIATFARVTPKTPGVGTALFSQSKLFAIQADFAAINATIRVDNRSGLTYYEKMGFETYSVEKGVPLSDGTTVDRISKRYMCR